MKLGAQHDFNTFSSESARRPIQCCNLRRGLVHSRVTLQSALGAGGRATTSLSRPAQASLALRPARSQPAQGGLLSRGFDPASYPTEPLGSYHVSPTTTWVDPPPLVLS